MQKSFYQQDDFSLYKKAKFRLRLRLIVSFIVLIAYFVGVYFLTELPFLEFSSSKLSNLILYGLIGTQLLLYLVLFLMLATGSKIFRIFYWIAYVFEIFLCGIPIYYFLQDPEHVLLYGTMLACMILKLGFLSALGSSLKQNRWSKIFFDYVVEIDEDSDEEDIVEEPNLYEPDRPINSEPRFQNGYQEEEEESNQSVYTLAGISVRLGICVYGSLMLFPIVVQIFSTLFISNDLQTVFATKDIFILCIASAVIWTVAIFFLYYEHPMIKRVLLGCVIAELITFCVYLPSFIGYITSGLYPVRVFLLFGIINLIRYFVIYIGLRPIKEY